MLNAAIASLVLLGATTVAGDWGFTATNVGFAHVVNKCNYPVKLCNVPSSGGGYEQEDKILSAGESWSQPWLELSNGNGWSIKLSKDDDLLNGILQYEYTFHNDGIIWYDLSCVDGNPWDKDWEITANGTECNPKQQAYRYSTDDAYGMQSCSQDAAITVTLCTGTSVDDSSAIDAPPSGSSDDSTSAPVYTPKSSPPSYEDTDSSSSAPTPTTAPAATSYAYNWNSEDAAKSSVDSTATPTTLITTTTPTYTDKSGGVVVVTQVETVYATAIAEITSYGRVRRRHEHGRRHEHHA